MELTPHREQLRTLSRTDPDRRVRHRADGLLLVANGRPWVEAARRLGWAPNSLRTWTRRLLAEGRAGLADRPRRGRPPSLDPEAGARLEQTFAASPLDDASPVTTSTLADRTDLLARRGGTVCRTTVWRRWGALGDRDRGPRHDLTHRQDPAAVDSAKHVWRRELPQKGLLPERDSAVSTGMNVKSSPSLTWQKSGSAEAVQ